MEFRPMPKTPRLSREIVITEKIDGTNASVFIAPHGEFGVGTESIKQATAQAWLNGTQYWLFAGSRTRWITPEDDNFGFARWVAENAEELAQLGPGHHFGEWWGKGIQRGYGLEKRRFSLFNVGRWADRRQEAGVFNSLPIGEGREWAPGCCHVVPELYRGQFTDAAVQAMMNELVRRGSLAAPGFMDPEGIMVYHTVANQFFKKTLKGDEVGKHAEAHPKKEKPPRPPRDLSKGGRRKADVPINFPDRRRR